MRDLTREAQQHARRRLRRRALPGTLLFLVLALAFLPFAGREPAMGVVGAVLLATVLATSTAAVPSRSSSGRRASWRWRWASLAS